jgi:hypothetical protein
MECLNLVRVFVGASAIALRDAGLGAH